MISQSDVTIIIPHLGTNQEQRYSLMQCMDSLLETCECKIVLAINGTKDRPVFIYRPEGSEDRIKVIQIEDQGQCKAVNAAGAIVNTPWILVTNDDMIYAPGWFEQLIWTGVTRNTLFDDPNMLCISPKLIEPRPGAPTFEVYMAGGAGGDFNKEAWLLYAKEHLGSGGGLRTGFNLPFLIKKELWDLIGGYDVNYDSWGSNSDSDLEYKIKLAGVQPYQNANSLVYHFSQTSGTFEPKNQSAWNRNWEYFIEKWGFPRTDVGIWEANFEIPNEGRKFRPEWEGYYNRP